MSDENYLRHYVIAYTCIWLPNSFEWSLRCICLALFLSQILQLPQTASLGLSLTKDEIPQNCAEHIEFLRFVMTVLNRSFGIATALTGDSCSTSQSMNTKLRKPLLQSSIHSVQNSVWETFPAGRRFANSAQTLIVISATNVPNTAGEAVSGQFALYNVVKQ